VKKLLIPPFFLLVSSIAIVHFYFMLPGLNYIAFPYNLGGLLILIAGFFFMGTTRELFRKHKTNLSIEKSSSIITEGLFSKTRNPMYIGMFLMLTGIAVCFRNILGLAMPFLFLLFVSFYIIPIEERLMEEVFGQEYLDYKTRVNRWF
jgi:protein-S-isoprenylcysteine O-methyltransferase Ste14